MKVSSTAWVLAMLSMTTTFVRAQDETAAADGEEVVDNGVEVQEFPEDFQPQGPDLDIYMQEQAAFNWSGFKIRAPYTEAQAKELDGDYLAALEINEDLDEEDEQRKTKQQIQDELIEAEEAECTEATNGECTKVIGQMNGQTGWTQINVDGDFTMSYRVSFFLQAENDLRDIITAGGENANRSEGTWFGWWIPMRDQNNPPEDWQMNLIEVQELGLDNAKFTYRQTVMDDVWKACFKEQVPVIGEDGEVVLNDDGSV